MEEDFHNLNKNLIHNGRVKDESKDKKIRERCISPLSKTRRNQISIGDSKFESRPRINDGPPYIRKTVGNFNASHRKNRSHDRLSLKSNSAMSMEDLLNDMGKKKSGMSDAASVSSDVSYKSKFTRPKPLQQNEKWSMQFVRYLIGRNEGHLIKILKDSQNEFRIFFSSPFRHEHMNVVIDFVLKICSFDFELSKRALLIEILSSEPFIKNLSTFIERSIEFCRTETQIVNCMKQISLLFSNILNYIPNDKLMLFNNMVSKASEVTRGLDEISSDLIESFVNFKDIISKKVEIFEEDFITYKSLSVFPTLKEVKNDCLLNIRNIEVGAYENVAQYIDTQFKLLKEDYVYGVRAGMKQHLQEQESNKRSINHDIFLYKNVIYEGLSEDDNPMKKILHVFSLDGSPLKKVNWDSTKRLIHGSLLFFSDNNFDSFFLAVLDDMKRTDSGSLILFVALVGIECKLQRDSNYVVIESRVFFEPYFQVCNTLKEIHPQLFPMSKYIIFGETTPKPPKYLKSDSRIEIDGYEVSLRDRHSWPEPEKIGLNQSQLEAVQAALTREFVIIQGPPGTGKTYLGIRLINILLDNVDLWSDNKSPIFIACYRNGAVDQILDSFTDKEDQVRRVVRLGNRSSSNKMKNCTLKNTVGHRRDPIMFLALNELKDDLVNIKQKLNELEKCKLFVLNKQGVLKHELFTKIFSEKQIKFFASPNAYENWLLVDDLYEDFYFDGEDDVMDSLFNEIVNKRKKKGYSKFLDENHPFVLISLRALTSEIMSIDYELCCLQETADKYSMDMDQLSKFSNLISLYNSKENTLRKIVERLRIEDDETDVARLSLADLGSLNIKERWTLYNFWVKQFLKVCDSQIEQLVESYNVKLIDFLYKRDMNDGENLRSAGVDIVGATTTCAARLNKLLSVMKPKIVLIEEAAEVLEAHTVASLTEHCEHLILIGDHKQLKPSPASHISSTKYRMDISLFERMILNGMECFSLTEQHRMRPEISALVSPYIYKNLKNHPSVENYPDLKGFKKNMFFLDHSVPEDQLRDNDSHQNKYEAHLALQMANYIRQQGYETQQITVLTLYVAQLLYMKSIRNQFPLLDDVEMQVVDNFQGEENDIIILSLVRSKSQTIGFLSKENRVCVALSRAKEGFIMIGNMETLQVNSQVWKEMRKVLVQSFAIDSSVPLRCETHKRITKVKTIEDFIPLVYGGCTDECGMKLECGHVCDYICHPLDTEHVKSFSCTKPCNRKRNCNIHDCQAACGVECPPCDVKIPELLACGHDGFRICAGEILKCETPCPTVLECGHACPRKCHSDDDKCHSEIECNAICDKKNQTCPFLHHCQKKCKEDCGECQVDSLVELDCGHVVKGVCSDIANKKCEITVNKELLCGHLVETKCCTPISEIKCRVMKEVALDCTHTVEAECGTQKNDIKCDATVEKHLSCGHTANDLCCKNIEEISCEERVNRTLDCGHILENAVCSHPPETLMCVHKIIKHLPCGHQVHVNCGDPHPKCTEMVEITDTCGHSKQVVCFETQNKGSTVSMLGSKTCKTPCNEILPCKHKCSGTCGKCIQGRIHVVCNAVCGDLLICGHKCTAKCWTDFHTCKNECINSCEHGTCSRKCGEICKKCMEPCKWACQHYKCTKKCWEVCNRPQCQFPCSLMLPCNHPCFGFCGEPCPPICLLCSPEDTKQISERYILLEDCGHSVSQSSLADLMEKTVGLLRCPMCLVPVVKTNYVRCLTKAFFIKFSKVTSFAAELYNNRKNIIRDFSFNFKNLNDVLKNTYEDCDSLNHLLQHLLKRTSLIMKHKNSTNETKLGLKTLLFICFYIIDTLKLTEVGNEVSSNRKIHLPFINHLASYLFSRVKKNKISPREMCQFAQELDRLKCIKDFVFLKDEQCNSSDTAILMKDENKILELLHSHKEFSKEDKIQVTEYLLSVKRTFLSNYHPLSSDGAISNKIIEFFKKYYPMSFHIKNWAKCKNKHNFFLSNSANECPICFNKTSNSLYYG